MKVFVLSPKESWICDRIASEWTQNNREITVESPEDADVLWLLAGWCWNHINPNLLASKKVILTVHHIVPEKFDNQKHQEFLFRDRFIDAYHVPNRKTLALVNQLTSKPIYLVPYWYDETVWKPWNKSESRNQLGIEPEKFVVGSFQRDTEGTTGLPKLEKGPDLFCDFVEDINNQGGNDLHVLLGGWRRGYVIDRLVKAGISFDFYENVEIDTLKKMYAACDLYVVASRYEGGPQAVLEAAAMGVPIISRDVGMATDVLTPYCIVDIPKQKCFPSEEDVEFNFKNVKTFEIKTHKKNYIKMFNSLLENNK